MVVPNEKLQRARLEKHWSLAVASRRVGVSTNTFNRWERGLQVPQLATLDQLLGAFDMSAEALGFGFVVDPPQRVAQTPAQHVETVENEARELDTADANREAELVAVSHAKYLLKAALPIHTQPVSAARAEAEAEQCSRRQVIAALIGTPAAIFCARQGDNLSLLRAEEILTLCTSHIPLCWQLYFEGGRAEVEKVLPDYITQLATLAQQPSTYQKRAAALLSQAYQLASLLATQHQDYGAASTAARQGRMYGELADDSHLQVAASIRQALVAFYLKRPRQCLQAYQKAAQLAPQASPLLRGRVYAGLAEALSRYGDEYEARSALELARESFPEQAENDVAYHYTHFSHTSISTYEGLLYLNLHQYTQAEQAFTRIDERISRDAVPNRLELLVHQAMLALARSELDQTAHLVSVAMPMAHTLGSQLRSDQLYEIHEGMLVKWGHEPKVRELEGLFR